MNSPGVVLWLVLCLGSVAIYSRYTCTLARLNIQRIGSF